MYIVLVRVAREGLGECFGVVFFFGGGWLDCTCLWVVFCFIRGESLGRTLYLYVLPDVLSIYKARDTYLCMYAVRYKLWGYERGHDFAGCFGLDTCCGC